MRFFSPPAVPVSGHKARGCGPCFLRSCAPAEHRVRVVAKGDTGCVSRGGTASFRDGCFPEKGLEMAAAIRKSCRPWATSVGQTMRGEVVLPTRGPSKAEPARATFPGRCFPIRPCGQRGRGTPRRLTRCPPRPCRPGQAGRSRGAAAGVGPGLACCPAGSSPSLCLVSSGAAR